MNNKIKHIIWDFDGTLFDTYPGMVHAFKKALEDSGIEAETEEVHEKMKVSVANAINYYKESGIVKDDFIDKFTLYEKTLGPEKMRPFPHAKEICRDFVNRGGKIYILTHRGNSTHRLLEFHGMLEYFTEIITKHSGFKRKPDPEGLLYLLNKYNIDKDSVILVGDRELEILAAKAAGIKACLYNTNNIKYEEEPDFIINSLRELYKITNI